MRLQKGDGLIETGMAVYQVLFVLFVSNHLSMFFSGFLIILPSGVVFLPPYARLGRCRYALKG